MRERRACGCDDGSLVTRGRLPSSADLLKNVFRAYCNNSHRHHTGCRCCVSYQASSVGKLRGAGYYWWSASLVTRPSTCDGLVQWGIPLNGANRPITKIPVIMYNTPPVRRTRCSVQGWKMQINPSANLTMLLLSFMPAARSHDQRREARNRNSLYEPSFRPPIPSTRSCK